MKLKAQSLEVKVGLLILAALALLGGFLFILGGVRLGEGYTLYVDFNNPGAVQPGAPVRVAGMKVGSVEDVEYRGGRLDPRTGRRALVRMRVTIDEKIKNTIHEDALFYVTAQGVLGEQFIAIDPGSYDKPVLREGAVVQGLDPPRLDLALALGYELLETLTKALRDNRQEIGDLLQGAADLLRNLNHVLGDNRERIDRIVMNVESATQEANDLVHSLRQRVDGPEVRRILANLDRTLSAVAQDIRPIMSDLRTATHSANETLAAVGPTERADIQRTIHNASQMAERANRAVADAQHIVAHMRQGRGTIGAFMMDEEVYDDVQELIRDLKHNPWKFFWRE